MSQSFEGKVVLITGGTSGIGKAAALEYAKQGASVVITGRRNAEGQEVVKQIQAASGTAHFVQGDIAVEADVKRMVDETVEKFGRLDVAFNNAGIELFQPITEATEDDYRKVFDVNVLGVLYSLKYEVPAMLASGGGSIVNTSSIAGQIGFAGAGIYTASKHAVDGITRTAALELSKQGIRVNSVAPGAIITDMTDRAFGVGESETKQMIASLHPIGRMGRAEEVAAAVVWLSSPSASFITGSILPVDGAFTAQ
jgi:NAD(P)-dependent dehydrogenase (short-subunit alcohol dehydrogenase family)